MAHQALTISMEGLRETADATCAGRMIARRVIAALEREAPADKASAVKIDISQLHLGVAMDPDTYIAFVEGIVESGRLDQLGEGRVLFIPTPYEVVSGAAARLLLDAISAMGPGVERVKPAEPSSVVRSSVARTPRMDASHERTAVSQIARTGGKRIYCGNLSFQSTQDEVRELFASHGEVTAVHLVMDRETGRSRGFAFIEMATEESAQAAIRALDGTPLQGRNLKINEAQPRQGGGKGRWGGGRR